LGGEQGRSSLIKKLVCFNFVLALVFRVGLYVLGAKNMGSARNKSIHLGMYCSVWEIFMSSFQEEFVIFCIQEDSATVMMECSLNLKIVWQHWSFQYDRVAKSQRFSRFRTMSNEHVFCVNLRFVFYETSEASTVVHDIR
jgi:hypothetical protein